MALDIFRLHVFSVLTLLTCVAVCFYLMNNSNPGSRPHLNPHHYASSCSRAQDIVHTTVAKAVAADSRMAASLLRLHYHDCFVRGCDASLLLDSLTMSEKRSRPNRNSARGFEVIDEIKSALEKECPQTVSCADILALAARDSVVLAGGPRWEVPLGRRDSIGASLSDSNYNIPAPNDTFHTILAKFGLQGLDIFDLVALSGSHSIGNARCVSFRQSLYNQSAAGFGTSKLNESYAAQLRARCPSSSGASDANLFPLDFSTPTKFDNSYFKNLVSGKGLLSSDRALVSNKNRLSMELVKIFAESNELFFKQFVKSVVKMGNISPLTGSRGEIRNNCRVGNA
ncbi:UNVERIFIED_CONTAM: Peroxidase 72 [Sesamum radiatum]|uniref:Peroxidase n=1 Tax=Sesamum radiatum TaxID=300843 RepID=A0AAW2UPK4_SESRA